MIQHEGAVNFIRDSAASAKRVGNTARLEKATARQVDGRRAQRKYLRGRPADDLVPLRTSTLEMRFELSCWTARKGRGKGRIRSTRATRTSWASLAAGGPCGFLGAGLRYVDWTLEPEARRAELLGCSALVLWLFNMLLFVFLNKFISDGTYVHHRNCFDLWDFVLGMWDLIVGPVARPRAVLVLYLIATINVFRVDASLFTGNIGWLDPGLQRVRVGHAF